MISSPKLLRYDRVCGEVLDSRFNTDHGSQFTSLEFTTRLNDAGIQISMDGTGCWRDNVFVERLWRSVKYEEVYLLTPALIDQWLDDVKLPKDFFKGKLVLDVGCGSGRWTYAMTLLGSHSFLTCEKISSNLLLRL